MSLTPWLPTVRKIKDGEPVDQATVNVPIDQLTQREQHLYEKFEELSGKSVLISFGQPIHPDEKSIAQKELNVVYYLNDSNGSGVRRGTTGFSSTKSSSMFSPNDSNYIFGVVKAVYSKTSTVDLYTEGLCELEVDIDDETYGLIQKNNGVVETFTPGPYFLSSKVPGKITNDPAGIPVYVGYAISKRKFLLHTSVDEFSQFFINYRYHVLDRVAGIPEYDDGASTWSILPVDEITPAWTSRVGWIPASESGAAAIPTGAVFYYNIPGDTAILLDTGLDYTEGELTNYFERDEASELRKYLPPIPANFVQLYLNGTLVRYKDEFDLGGLYSLNEYGLWWHSDKDGEQPWSPDYPIDKTPADWRTDIKTAIASSRKNIFISFSKFNPALRTQLVSAIRPFDAVENGEYINKSSNFIKFYNADRRTEASPTGSLLVDIDAKVNSKGFSDNSDLDYPSTIDSEFTADRAIAGFKYSKPDGEFLAVITPVVAKLQGVGGITVTPDTSPGVFNIAYLSSGNTGSVDSIEPINARLEFRGLSSYIKLPPPTTTPYGMIGKIAYPKGALNNRTMDIVFHLFGDIGLISATNKTVAFQFEYSAVCASNSAASSDYTSVDTSSYKSVTTPTVEFSIADSLGNYTAYQSLKISTGFTIPAEFVREDSIINYKILRVAPANPTATSYTGNVGVLNTYWQV